MSVIAWRELKDEWLMARYRQAIPPPCPRPAARGGPIGVNGSPCEGDAGHPQGLALL